jgi:hypothetical protein
MTSPIEFPVRAVPEEGRLARLVGLYPQRQEGFFLQRVRAAGGRLTSEQWKTLAGIQTTLTAEPLHLTTRQIWRFMDSAQRPCLRRSCRWRRRG